jgi:hypothetical protein
MAENSSCTAARRLTVESDQEAFELDRQPSRLELPTVPYPDPTQGPIRRGLAAFWRHHISMSVPHADCRDHLGMSLTLSCSP